MIGCHCSGEFIPFILLNLVHDYSLQIFVLPLSFWKLLKSLDDTITIKTQASSTLGCYIYNYHCHHCNFHLIVQSASNFFFMHVYFFSCLLVLSCLCLISCLELCNFYEYNIDFFKLFYYL